MSSVLPTPALLSRTSKYCDVPRLVTLARRAVVAREHDDRVVPLAARLEFGAQPTQVLVDTVDHGGIDLLVAGEELAFVVGEVVPGRDGVFGLVVAGRQLGVLGDDPELLLAREALLSDDVPTCGVLPLVLGHVVGLRLEGRMHGAVGEVEEERLVGMVGAELTDHADGLIGQVVGEVVVVVELVDVEHPVVLEQLVRLVEVREPVEDPVVALEPDLERPRLLRPAHRVVAVLAQVPLADTNVAQPESRKTSAIVTASSRSSMA